MHARLFPRRNAFRSVDFEARTLAQKGKVMTPSGRELPFERIAAHAHLAAMLNMRPAELAIPRNRCIYNIKSALWAGENFRKDIQYRVRGTHETVDHELTEIELSVRSQMDSMSPEDREGAEIVLQMMRDQSRGVTHTTGKTPRRSGMAKTSIRARNGLTRGGGVEQDRCRG